MTERELFDLAAGLPDTYAMTADEASGAPESAWGDSFFYYGDERSMPYATIVVSNYPGFDEASGLDRDGVFRLNAAVGRECFIELLGHPPGAPGDVDYRALDVLLPHPVYATQSWVSILNPSAEHARALLERAHSRAR
jgi:hypothetical protein